MKFYFTLINLQLIILQYDGWLAKGAPRSSDNETGGRAGQDPSFHSHAYISLPYYHCRIFPFGQADLLCCSALAVYEYGFMRCAAHINM